METHNGLIHRLESQQQLLGGQDGDLKEEKFIFSAKRKMSELSLKGRVWQSYRECGSLFELYWELRSQCQVSLALLGAVVNIRRTF